MLQDTFPAKCRNCGAVYARAIEDEYCHWCGGPLVSLLWDAGQSERRAEVAK